MAAMASSNCWRQSQRREWKTSAVRHWEWTRTMGGAVWMSPMTRATADSVRMRGGGMLSLQAAGFSTMPSKPRMRNCPQRVGKSASATFVTLANGMISLYVSVLMDIGFAMRGFDAGDRGLSRVDTDLERKSRMRMDQH